MSDPINRRLDQLLSATHHRRPLPPIVSLTPSWRRRNTRL